MSGDGGGFLSRWSRRKRAAGVAPPPQPAAPVPPEAAAPPPGAAPAFDPASLPPIESLTSESDFAAFLRDEVPAALRRAALRRAWALDPAIRDFVGPADYAWDFNAPDGMPGFSLTLGGDVKRLLAQAIGLEEAPEEGASGGAAAPSVTMAEPAADARPAPLLAEDGAAAGAPLAPPLSGALAEAPAAERAALEEPADAPPVMASASDEALAEAPGGHAPSAAESEPKSARRRHGGALPS